MNNTTAIKQYQKLTIIILKSWKTLRTTASLEEVQKTLSNKSTDYIVIDWVGFNRLTEVSEFFEFVPDDMECFILAQPKDVQAKLRTILKEREANGHQTKGTEHLRKIYESRFLWIKHE